ncbi:hypothetical protein N7G274_007461 [Stereocaulon virgatum]|uniref:Uncharacterized protein n=1 Tax=Stereocaulon virgatum TaxID=373712 RepID=A0ABR4A5C5_9LECA
MPSDRAPDDDDDDDDTFQGIIGFARIIWNQQGEIRVTAVGGALQVTDDEQNIAIHNFATDKVGMIQWETFHQLDSICKRYCSFVRGLCRGETVEVFGFEHPVLGHRQIQEAFKESVEKRNGVCLYRTMYPLAVGR